MVAFGQVIPVLPGSPLQLAIVWLVYTSDEDDDERVE